MTLRLPLRVENGRARFSIEHEDAYATSCAMETCYQVCIYGDSGQFAPVALTLSSLRAFADLIYRACGEQPRDVGQIVRVVVEHVAAAPPASAPALERSDEDAEKEAIKLRLMK